MLNVALARYAEILEIHAADGIFICSFRRNATLKIGGGLVDRYPAFFNNVSHRFEEESR